MGKSQVIWLGFAHVKRMGPGKPIGNTMGAEVYIAIRADGAEEFRHKAIAAFRQNGMQMVSIEDIETEFDVPKEDEHPNAIEKKELFVRLSQGRIFAFGPFYPYGTYERPPKIEQPQPQVEEEEQPAQKTYWEVNHEHNRNCYVAINIAEKGIEVWEDVNKNPATETGTVETLDSFLKNEHIINIVRKNMGEAILNEILEVVKAAL